MKNKWVANIKRRKKLLFADTAATAAKLLQSCPTLHNPMVCSLPGFSVHGIFQARVLEWDAIAFSNLQILWLLIEQLVCALAWRIPWTEVPGRLQSMGSLRVGHDWATSLSLFTFMHWRRKWQPTPVFLPLENPRDGGAWWASVYGVTQSRTWLKWLSSSHL